MNTKTILKSLKIITRKINKIECALLQTNPIVKKHTNSSFTCQTNNLDDDDYDAYIQKIIRQGGL